MAEASGGSGIKCPLCLDPCDKQRVLTSCFHSFCEKCIATFTRTFLESKQACKCPLCHTSFQEPVDSKVIHEWSLNLPLNPFLSGNIEEPDKNNENCEPCEFRGFLRKARWFCTTCNEAQCQDCSSVHQSSRGTRCHHIVDTKDAGNTEKRLNVELFMSCAKHTEKQVEFFCEEHDVFVCSKCAIKEHRGCSLKDMTTIDGTCMKNDHTGEIVEDMQRMVTHLAKVCRTAKDECNSFGKDVTKFKSTMKAVRDKVNAVFDSYEKECNQKLLVASKCQKQSLKKLEKEKEQYELAMENALQMLGVIQQFDNPYHRYFFEKKISRQRHGYDKLVQEKRSTVLTMNLKTVIFKKVNSIIEGKTVGSMDIQVKEIDLPIEHISRSSLHLGDISKAAETTIDKKDNANGSVGNMSDNVVEVSDEDSTQPKSRNDKECVCLSAATIYDCLKTVCISDIAFLDDERVVVLDANSRKLLLIDKTISKIICEKTLQDKPENIAAFSTTELAITIQNDCKILIIIVTDRITPLWSIKTRDIPRGIELLPGKKLLVYNGSDGNYSGSCFETLDVPSGNLIEKVTIDHIKECEHFAVDPTGLRIYASCLEKDELLCLGMKGNRIFSYKVAGPVGVDVDKFGNVYVLSETTRTIHKVSQTGRCMTIFECNKSLVPKRLKMNYTREKFAVTFHDSPVMIISDIQV